MKERMIILMAGDNPDDALNAREVFHESHINNELHLVDDSVELLDYLKRKGKYSKPDNASLPCIILLNMNLMLADCKKVLSNIKKDTELKDIPVIVLTTSQSDLDVMKTCDLGADSYITRPVSLQGLSEVFETMGKYGIEIVKI